MTVEWAFYSTEEQKIREQAGETHSRIFVLPTSAPKVYPGARLLPASLLPAALITPELPRLPRKHYPQDLPRLPLPALPRRSLPRYETGCDKRLDDKRRSKAAERD